MSPVARIVTNYQASVIGGDTVTAAHSDAAGRSSAAPASKGLAAKIEAAMTRRALREAAGL